MENFGNAGGVHIPITADPEGVKEGFAEAKKIAKSETESMAKGLKDVSEKMVKYLVLPMAGLSAAVIKYGADFQNEMKKSTAIMGSATAEQKKQMAAVARQLATQGVTSAKSLAQGYYYLASAGMDSAAAMKALGTVAKFSEAGHMDLAMATSYLADTQAAMGMKSEDATKNLENMNRVANVVAGSANLVNADINQMSEALVKAAPSAVQANKGLIETAAVLSMVAEKGIKGSLAAEQFNIIMNQMPDFARKNEAAWKKMNIAIFEEGGPKDGQWKNFADIADQMTKAFAGMSPEAISAEMALLGFGAESIKMAVKLVGAGDRIRQLENQLQGFSDGANGAGSEIERISREQLGTFWSKLDMVKNKLVEVALKVFDLAEPMLMQKFIPALESGIGGMDRFVESMSKMSGKEAQMAKEFGLLGVSIVGGVIALGALSGAVIAIGAVSGAAAATVSMFTIALTAIGGVAIIIKNNFDSLTKGLKSFGNHLMSIIGWMEGEMVRKIGLFFGAFGADETAAQFQQWADNIKAAANDAGLAAKAIDRRMRETAFNVGRYFQKSSDEIGQGVADIIGEFGTLNSFLKQNGPELQNNMESPFFKAADEIVGHSIVPDMVRSVTGWMRRMASNMGETSKAAADATLEQFARIDAINVPGDASGITMPVSNIDTSFMDGFQFDPQEKIIPAIMKLMARTRETFEGLPGIVGLASEESVDAVIAQYERLNAYVRPQGMEYDDPIAVAGEAAADLKIDNFTRAAQKSAEVYREAQQAYFDAHPVELFKAEIANLQQKQNTNPELYDAQTMASEATRLWEELRLSGTGAINELLPLVGMLGTDLQNVFTNPYTLDAIANMADSTKNMLAETSIGLSDFLQTQAEQRDRMSKRMAVIRKKEATAEDDLREDQSTSTEKWIQGLGKVGDILQMFPGSMKKVGQAIQVMATVWEIAMVAMKLATGDVLGLVKDLIGQIVQMFSKTEDETKTGMAAVMDEIKGLAQEWADELTNMIVEFIDTGEISLGEFFKNITKDVLNTGIKYLIMDPLLNFLGDMLFAKGGVVDGGSVSPFEKGGVVGAVSAFAQGAAIGMGHVVPFASGGAIVSTPTLFGLSGGKTGLMGEAGPEGIMPLERMSNGDLGVQADGLGGSSTVVQVVDQRGAGAPPIEVSRSWENAVEIVQMIVRSEMSESLPGVLETAYGMRQRI